MKSGSLKLLEPSGPVKACNGIALPFTFAKSVEKLKVLSESDKSIGDFTLIRQ
jgi:hypothetical protein